MWVPGYVIPDQIRHRDDQSWALIRTRDEQVSYEPFGETPSSGECPREQNFVDDLRRLVAALGGRVPAGDFGSMISLMNQYTAAIQKDGAFWIGWIEEVPGVNSQGNSREELLENLRSALSEALQMNREEALQAAGDHFEEVHISA